MAWESRGDYFLTNLITIYGTKRKMADKLGLSLSTVRNYLEDFNKLNLYLDEIERHAREQGKAFNKEFIKRYIRVKTRNV